MLQPGLPWQFYFTYAEPGSRWEPPDAPEAMSKQITGPGVQERARQKLTERKGQGLLAKARAVEKGVESSPV